MPAHDVAVVAAAAAFEQSALAASFSFSFRYYEPVAEAVVSVSTHHCTPRTISQTYTETLQVVSPSGGVSSTNLVAHWVCVASKDEHWKRIEIQLVRNKICDMAIRVILLALPCFSPLAWASIYYLHLGNHFSSLLIILIALPSTI